ncbi:nucleotidyltransferase [Alkalihalobacillus sp. FSL R5-0424]
MQNVTNQVKAVGMVVEYNPFHNGHLYQLQQAKQDTGADVVVAVMSSSFLQRGEPALLSKWSRTKMALANGVDLVLELPYAYASQKAETFAKGAISILAAAGVDFLHFGSESGSIEEFHELLNTMQQHEGKWDLLVKEYMSQGHSYPRAASLAFTQLGADTTLSLEQPNNILGYHYLKAIRDQNSAIIPFTTKRIAAGYHDRTISSPSIASATSIREAIFSSEDQTSLVKQVMPPSSYTELMNYSQTTHQLHNWERYFPFLQYRILSSTADELSSIYECVEGLEFRILDTIGKATSFQGWMSSLKTKRYTWTRLQRLATHILTHTTKAELNRIHTSPLPYIRPLGMNKTGQLYLRTLKKNATVPILSRFASSEDLLATLELRASRAYLAPLSQEVRHARMDEEFKAPIRL